MILYAGIDPGLHGAISAISETGDVVYLSDTPILVFKKGKKIKTEYDLPGIKKIIKDILALRFVDLDKVTVIIFLEKMQSMPPGIRVQASFSLGYSQGVFEGLLTALEVPYRLVTPKTWQKHFQISKEKGDKKAQSLQIASKLFPTAELTGPRGGQKDGRSDALLIAEWGRSITMGEKND